MAHDLLTGERVGQSGAVEERVNRPADGVDGDVDCLRVAEVDRQELRHLDRGLLDVEGEDLATQCRHESRRLGAHA